MTPKLQFSSAAQSCLTLCNPMDCSTSGLPVHHQLPEPTQTHVHRAGVPSNHLILCCPLLLLPSIFPSIRVFPNESALRIRWTKYWSFSFNISPSNEHPGLISFKIDWIDLLTVQGTLKRFLQHHKSKASIFSALSLLYQFSSVAQSCLTLCDPMQHSRPPWPSPTPGVHSNSCPLSR